MLILLYPSATFCNSNSLTVYFKWLITRFGMKLSINVLSPYYSWNNASLGLAHVDPGRVGWLGDIFSCHDRMKPNSLLLSCSCLRLDSLQTSTPNWEGVWRSREEPVWGGHMSQHVWSAGRLSPPLVWWSTAHPPSLFHRHKRNTGTHLLDWLQIGVLQSPHTSVW